ncbi:protein of unknown function DUF423 [Thalassoporum mexicanum PCC 7367]|uniref:DUF423 domain-containing protein n=1 Tax=Thalassoporum mexicanum TaxID=3457544 RepID=UPI00029FFA1D|nr:DUF423 domain-containing protein [Pseudanabaena sp. PCC 7367]AFY68859.1 protein of unknown function DUF423 [Pseudanabaena sp. PCC 7367]
MAKIFIAIAAILAGIGVAAGAFASHALKDRITEKAIAIFETGVRYQMYHALALLAVGLLLLSLGSDSDGNPLFNVTGFAFIAGIAIFSGSLYALSLSGIKWLGAITPLGGVAFLIGWGCLAVAAFQLKS